MKKATLHTFSILMALLFLFSTMSFTVKKHFCGKSLVSHAVFSSVQKCKSESHTCGVESMMSHKEMDKESCCTDKTECISGQDELNVHSLKFDFAPQTFIIPISLIVLDFLSELSPEINHYPPYKPPQLVYDIHVLCEVYTI